MKPADETKLKTLKSKKGLSHIGGSIGDERPNHNGPYFTPKSGNKLFKKGHITLFRLIFHFHHASGMILKKSALNLKQALKYCGFLWVQVYLIGQCILNRNILLTTKILANRGEKEYKSGHKTRNQMKPFNFINKYRTLIILDLMKGKKYRTLRKELLIIVKNLQFIIKYVWEFTSWNQK